VGDCSNIFHVALLLSFRWCCWINLTYGLFMMREAVLRPNCMYSVLYRGEWVWSHARSYLLVYIQNPLYKVVFEA
jgi:hypothetical protein